jgi:putative FmdB family regulatory protein
MPIFEYVCESCGHHFEAIVMGSQEASCPKCNAHELQQQMSKFAAHSKSGSHAHREGPPCGSGGCCMGPGGGCDMN